MTTLVHTNSHMSTPHSFLTIFEETHVLALDEHAANQDIGLLSSAQKIGGKGSEFQKQQEVVVGQDNNVSTTAHDVATQSCSKVQTCAQNNAHAALDAGARTGCLEVAANSSSEEGVEVTREEGWNSVTRKKKASAGMNSSDRPAGARSFNSTNTYDVLMAEDQVVADNNMEKGSKLKEGQLVVVSDENNGSSNSCTPAKINLTAMVQVA
ncbi:hypothetical protein A4A49_21983 [Nicotiana attenuata]|uniref:Uncharacterized protein n=1 Tax=Nicotiana attenuata TaxID=49451 RepID=A0A1J6HU23_NICAT|nr:hypothetical protein A4A49_21983 [Nicotiana attenuata]